MDSVNGVSNGLAARAVGVPSENGDELRTDVAIVGGGIVGALLGAALAREGVSSVICDPIPAAAARAVDFDGRAYAIALASRRFLTHLGLWDALAPHAQEIEDIYVSDGRLDEGASPFFLHFDHREMGRAGFGHLLEDRHLRNAALDAAAAASPFVAYLEGARVASVETEEGFSRVRLEDGRTIRARVVAACDGRRSRVAAAAGLDRMEADYGQVGLVCAIRHEKPHHGIAHEYFMPSGPFAILPLTGDRCSLVWTERAEMAEALQRVEDAVYLSEIRRRMGGLLGEIALDGKRWAYPLNLSVARSFVAPRLVLAGDAARGIHPIAGQGLNYGLRDVAALAETLGAAAGRGEDVGALDVLERYERWRRPDSLAIAAATHGLNRLFSNDISPLRWARRLGLAAFGQVGPLRRAAMRFAAGDRDDLPISMRG